MIKIIKTEYSRMPKSINNHTMKSFMWNNRSFWIDKETDSLPNTYRLYETGNGMILDYFCEGESWDYALGFVEGYLTLICGKQ